MYQRQELSVHVRELETKYDAELKYLFTNGILIITKNAANKITRKCSLGFETSQIEVLRLENVGAVNKPKFLYFVKNRG